MPYNPKPLSSSSSKDEKNKIKDEPEKDVPTTSNGLKNDTSNSSETSVKMEKYYTNINSFNRNPSANDQQQQHIINNRVYRDDLTRSSNYPTNSSVNRPHLISQHTQSVYLNQVFPSPPPPYVQANRLLNNMEGLDLGARSLLHSTNTTNPSIASFNHQPYNLYNQSNTLPHRNMSNGIAQNQIFQQHRYETELERYRLKMLAESELASGSLRSSQNSLNRLNELDYNAALLRSDIYSHESKDKQIAELDQQLNQREYEVQELNNKFNLEISKMNKEVSKYKAIVKSKEDDFLNEKTKNMSLQKENDKLKSKLKECDEYIANLPTMDEVDEREKKFKELLAENEEMIAKINENDQKLNRAKLIVKEKMNEIKDLIEKQQNTEMANEKLRLEFENYKEASQSVGELMKRCEENSSLRAEFECAKKLCTNLQENIKITQEKHQEEVNSLKESLKLETDLLDSLRKELDTKDEVKKGLEKSIKELGQKNQSLLNETIILNEKLKSLEVLVNADSFQLLQILFKEMSSCAFDLESLVNNCIDIYKGRNVDVCSLLGVSDSKNKTDYLELSNNELIDSIANTDYLIRKTNELKQIGKKITEVRQIVTDEYANKLGSNASCFVQ